MHLFKSGNDASWPGDEAPADGRGIHHESSSAMNLTDEAAKAAGVHGAISIRICNNKGKYQDLRGVQCFYWLSRPK